MVPRPAKRPKPDADPGAKPPDPDAAGTVQVKVWLLGISPMVWRRLQPCCIDRGCGRNNPSPCCGSGNTDGDRASKLQHAVEEMDGNVDLSRPALVRA